MYSIKRFRLLFIFITSFISVFYFSAHYALAGTNVTDDITSNTIWTVAESPYIVSTNLYIAPSTTLTIEPGVVVKFESYSGLNVAGDIIANGNINNKITFTSILDDSIAGDTNEDADSTTPSKNDWSGIYFNDSHSSSFVYVNLRYATDILTTNNSDVNLQNIDMYESNTGINFYNNSHIVVNTVTAQNITSDVLSAYNHSTMAVDNITIQDIAQYAIEIFEDSSLTINNSSVKNVLQHGAFYVYGNSFLIADHLNVEDIFGSWDDAIDVVNHSNLLVDHSTFKNCPEDSCIAFYDSNDYLNNPSSVSAYNTLFDTGAGSAFITFGNSLVTANIQNCTIKNFDYLGIRNYSPAVLNAINNYWGDATGPYHPDLNPSGLGNGVSNNVDFIPFKITDPLISHNPVILIPGIMGSYLNKNFGDMGELWPNINALITSISDDFLNDLALRPDGTEDPAKPIQVGDIIRSINVTLPGINSVSHSFDGLINELTNGGYVENTDLFVFPYDWRKDDAEAAILLDSKIAAVLSQTGASKVDIVAHSMGGLVTKKYIADHGAGLIDKLVFIGTPHLGAPKAYKVLTYGDDMGIKRFNVPFLSANRVKYISQNMPGVFDLLPSEKYINDNGSYVINAKNNPVHNLNYSETKDFMNTQGRNMTMFTPAESLHNDTDNLNLLNTDVYNFAGCGKTKTIGKIRVGKKRDWTHLGLTWKDDVIISYTNGDETVPLSSATSVDALNEYFVKNISHMDLPSADGLRQDVLAILTGADLPSSPVILSDVSDCKTSGHTVSVHSPATLDIYDSLGNHTGLNTDSDIEYGVLGVSYDIFDDVKYAFLPDGQNYRIVNRATDTGGYSLNIDNVANNDDITNSFSWNLVPLQTLNTNTEINIGPDYPENNYVLKADEDGNGSFEKTFPVNFDGTSLAEKAEEKPHHSSGGSVLSILNKKDDDKKENLEEKNISELNSESQRSVLKNLAVKGPTLTNSVFKRSFLKGVQGATLIHLNPESASQTASAINSGFKIKDILIVFSICILAFIVGKRHINKL